MDAQFTMHSLTSVVKIQENKDWNSQIKSVKGSGEEVKIQENKDWNSTWQLPAFALYLAR